MNYQELFSYIKLLPRLPQSLGFGVQSPSAYYFIKYVINEKYPYYSYDILSTANKELPVHYIKLCQLYFRLANFLQPHNWIDFTNHSNAISQYVIAGCKKVNYHDHTTILNLYSFDVALIDDCDESLVSKLIDSAKNDSLLIIEHIYSSKEKISLWKNLIQDNRVRVTFDMYDCGLIFFDNRPKNHYKLLLR